MSGNQAPQSQGLSKLEAAIDKRETSALQINRHGQVNFVNANQIMEFAKMMALGKQAIPPHLREAPGACLAVCIQASSWQMSPFAVANKSYVVNDRMAYEAQIIAAVILMRAPIIGRLKYAYKGEGATRQCTCTAKLDDGDEVDYQSPMIKDIKVKNSPLWQSDPDQQLAYYSARALARRHFPDVILGVYTPEEMAEETMREVTPPIPRFETEADPATPVSPTTVLPPGKPEVVKCDGNHGGPPCADPQCWHKSAPAAAETPVSTDSPEAAAVGATESPTGSGGGSAPPSDTDRETMLADLNKRMDKDGISAKTVKNWAAKEGLVASSAILTKDYPIEALQALDERWSEITGN